VNSKKKKTPKMLKKQIVNNGIYEEF